MVEFWIIAIGSVIIAVIAFTVAYNIMTAVVNANWKQESLRSFTDLYGTIESVCQMEINNSKPLSLTFQFPTRVVYATDDTENLQKKVFFQIRDYQESKGQNVCLQFKDEDKLRCFPEPPNELPCIVSIPHLGVLPESEDIFVKMNRIIGRGISRSYDFLIEKTGGKEVTVSIKGIETTPMTETTTTTTETTSETTTTTPQPSTCNLDEIVSFVDKEKVYEFLRTVADKPRPAEGWGLDTSWNKGSRDYIEGKLKEFGLENVKVESFTYDGNTGYNVVGEVGNGNKKIVIGAHRDSCGKSEPGVRCELTRGAVDNGAGTVTVMEIARVFASNCKDFLEENDYQVIFVLFDSEELYLYDGLLGSKAYVSSHGVSNIRYMFNFDCPSGFKNDQYVYAWLSDTSLSSATDECGSKFALPIQKTFSDPCGYDCSDHAPFKNRGVDFAFPLDLSLNGELCAGGGPSKGGVLHTASDNLSNVNKDKLVWGAKYGACLLRKMIS